MNIGELKRSVAAYLNPKPETGNPVDMFVIGTGPTQVDLLTLALNNVRVEAEQLRDFELSKVVVDVAIDAYSGAELSDALLHGTNIPIMIKSIRDGGIRQDGGELMPVEIQGLENYLQGRRTTEDCDTDANFYGRYPGDRPAGRSWHNKLLLQGESLFVTPATTVAGTVYNFELSVVRWLGPYENDSDEDFMTVFCHNYLMWAAIVEANHLAKQYVPRQEGNLPPPDKQKERAWAAVERWDDFIVESGRVPLLR